MELTKDSVDKLLSYNQETGEFTWKDEVRAKKSRIWPNMLAGHKENNGYVRITIHGRRHQAHRLAFLLMGQEIPQMVDHVNGKRDDNRWSNLRSCNRSQNQINSKIRATSKTGIRGVSWYKRYNKYVAKITCKSAGRKSDIHIGYFKTKEEARESYRRKAIELYGEEWLPIQP